MEGYLSPTERAEQVHAMMLAIPEPWRHRWCKADLCGCLGCVNGPGWMAHAYGLAKERGWEPYTEEEWQRWCELNPR